MTFLGWPFPMATSLVAQTVKRLSTMQETWVRSLGWEVPWRRKWQPTPGSCLENPMDRGAWCPWGRKESDTTERLHFHFPMAEQAGGIWDWPCAPKLGL